MNPTNDQVKGMLDRGLAVIVTMFLGWCVRKGYLGEGDAATLAPAIVLLPSLAWGWWNNRPKALVQSAAALPGTVVVTTPDLAKATPNESNIISNENAKDSIAATVANVKASQ
jgi:hypothetical protein